jgi:Mn2+/Fe2+ NRAMP family transporter
MGIATAVVLVPAIPLVPVLYLTQVLNAALLLVILPFIVRLARDPELLGGLRLGRLGTACCVAVIVAVAVACAALLVLGLTGA